MDSWLVVSVQRQLYTKTNLRVSHTSHFQQPRPLFATTLLNPSAMFALRGFSGSGDKKLFVTDYTILSKRKNLMWRITTLANWQVLFFFVITTCGGEEEPLAGVFLPLCVAST